MHTHTHTRTLTQREIPSLVLAETQMPPLTQVNTYHPSSCVYPNTATHIDKLTHTSRHIDKLTHTNTHTD